MTLLGSAEIASELISALTPFDAIESDHRTRAMTWLRETDDVCRRRKPATPSPHLVSYFVPLDPTERRMLLVEHRLAGLWLPPGGHVEPGEHPVATVFREATEELDLAATLLNGQTTPFFLTWTQTVGANSHIDVSLWYLLHGEADRELDLGPPGVRERPMVVARRGPQHGRESVRPEHRPLHCETRCHRNLVTSGVGDQPAPRVPTCAQSPDPSETLNASTWSSRMRTPSWLRCGVSESGARQEVSIEDSFARGGYLVRRSGRRGGHRSTIVSASNELC